MQGEWFDVKSKRMPTPKDWADAKGSVSFERWLSHQRGIFKQHEKLRELCSNERYLMLWNATVFYSHRILHQVTIMTFRRDRGTWVPFSAGVLWGSSMIRQGAWILWYCLKQEFWKWDLGMFVDLSRADTRIDSPLRFFFFFFLGTFGTGINVTLFFYYYFHRKGAHSLLAIISKRPK